MPQVPALMAESRPGVLKYWLIIISLGILVSLQLGFPGGIPGLLHWSPGQGQVVTLTPSIAPAAQPAMPITHTPWVKPGPLPWWLVPNPYSYQIMSYSVPFPEATPEVQEKAVECLRAEFGTGVRQDMKVYAQYGEDGILEHIFKCIGTTSKTYAEFGVQTGQECSTRWLREGHGFSGLLMDGGFENPAINLHKEIIYAETISDLLHKHKATFPSPDHMTVDLDLNTFHVAAAVLKAGWRPRSLIVEVNRNFLPHQSYAVVYNKEGNWETKPDCYFGASPLAYQRLAGHYGYQLIAADYIGVNLFFVHESALGGGSQQVHEKTPLKDHPLQQVYMAIHADCPGYQWVEVPADADFSGDWKWDTAKTPVLHHRSRQEIYRVMYESKVEANGSKVVPAAGKESKGWLAGMLQTSKASDAPAAVQDQLADVEWLRYTNKSFTLQTKAYHDEFMGKLIDPAHTGKPAAQLMGKRKMKEAIMRLSQTQRGGA